jgi:chemotaxis protein methyltransferase CheR
MEMEQYVQVKQTIRRLLNIDLEHYKDEQMRRRLDSWLVRSGTLTWQEYFSRLHSDGRELSRLRDYLTINVSAFFRDSERWEALKGKILPELLHDSPSLHIWSAGCSMGAEAYSLAMLLDEMGGPRKHSILATDLDRSILAKARAGGPYTTEEIMNLSSAQRAAYFQPQGQQWLLKHTFKTNIEFKEHNLLCDPFPANMDLIVCRNVVIYFTTQTKDQLYQRFWQALRPGGILFVGATEILPRTCDGGFRTHGISFYQKAGA